MSTATIEATIQAFAIAHEARFLRPIPFAKDRIDLLAQWFTDSANGVGSRPDEFRVRHTDIVFDYEIKASFYGGKGSFRGDAENATLNIHGARTQKDAELLWAKSLAYLDLLLSVQPADKIAFSFGATAFASVSADARNEFVERFRIEEKTVHPCAVAYMQLEKWPELIRVGIEPNLNAPESLFLTWNTKLALGGEHADSFRRMIDSLIDSIKRLGVTFHPLPLE